MVRFWIYFKDGVGIFYRLNMGCERKESRMIPTCLVSTTGRVGLPYEGGLGVSF